MAAGDSEGAAMDGTQDRKGKAERIRRAAAVQEALLGKFKKVEPPAARLDDAEAAVMVEDLPPAASKVMAGLSLHARRYGITHAARGFLRRMPCRSLDDVARARVSDVVGWLGERETVAVRVRLHAIVGEVLAGAAEPGISRMMPLIDDSTREWLSGRPIEDIVGRGVAARNAEALRSAGHETLLALATEDADAIEDIHGIGLTTVGALRIRLAFLVEEGAGSTRKRRRLSADDDEWASAAPDADD